MDVPERSTRRPSRTLLLLLAAGAAAAADGEREPGSDLRLVYSFGGDRYTIQTDTAAGSRRDDQRWNRADGVRVDWLGTTGDRFGLDGGLSVAGQRNVDDHGGESLRYQSLSGRVNLGVSVAPARQFQVEILPFAGFGMAELQYASQPLGVERSRDNEAFFEYGLNINAAFTTDHWRFGAGVGYLVTDSDFGFSAGAQRTGVDLEQHSPFYSVFIGTRL